MSRINPTDVIIQNAEVKDIEAIVKINKEEYWREDEQVTSSELFQKGSWWVVPELLNWHQTIINKCDGEILIAIFNNEIIGELDYVISPDWTTQKKIRRLHIVWLIVKRKYRNKGIAKLLINHLKSRFQNMEIWVEAEDERSHNLYSSIGNERRRIENWKLTIDSHNLIDVNNQAPITSKTISYDKLMDNLKNLELNLIVGRYYAPIFDLEQLRSSDEVYQYIWGNSNKSIIYTYQYKLLIVTVVLTQYLRIYVNSHNFSNEDFQQLLHKILNDVFDLGFEEIFAQTYSEDELDVPLKYMGFILDSENDYVFRL